MLWAVGEVLFGDGANDGDEREEGTFVTVVLRCVGNSSWCDVGVGWAMTRRRGPMGGDGEKADEKVATRNWNEQESNCSKFQNFKKIGAAGNDTLSS